VATTISETLPRDLYPAVVIAQARAHAWKDRGQALCYLSRYAEALEALERAEEQLEPFGTVAHDKAVVRFVRATTLRELGRLDECRTLLAECRTVFADHGDLRLELYCGIVDGTVLFSLHQLREAAATFTSLLDVATSLNDSLSEARLHSNIAHCLVLLGSHASAEEHLVRALAQFRANGAHTEAARAEVARGRMLVSQGDLANGVARLYEARRTFLTHGLIEEAGICGLDVVEALIARENFDNAVLLAREIIDDYTAAKLNARAVIALGYLSEAMAAREASAATVEHVRSYIQELLKEPEREFARMKM
jgi:tetratricopeptide (TPR) repeat protein